MLIAQRIISNVSVLSKLQQRFLVLLTLSIVCCRGRVNYLSLARVSGRNEKTFRRHFARSINFLALHRASIDEGLGRTPPGLRIIAFDPSFLPKAGKKTSGLGWFWNGSASRAAYGLEATVTAIVDVKSRNAMTLAIQQTIVPPKEKAPSDTTTKKATKKSSTESDELSRIDEYLRHIENVIPHLHIYERYWVVDGYFAKHKFIDKMQKLKQECITKLRVDANMTYLYTGEKRTGRGRPKIHDGKVDWKNLRSEVFERHQCADGTVLLTAILYHQRLKCRLRVVVVEQSQKDGSLRRTLLASTDLNVGAEEILEAYRARFQVEFLIRDGKSHTGLADGQARSKEAIEFHLNASMFTLNCARAEHFQRTAQNNQTTKNTFSMDSFKTIAFNEHFAEMIFSISGLPLEMLKNHPEYHNIRNYGVIAA